MVNPLLESGSGKREGTPGRDPTSRTHQNQRLILNVGGTRFETTLSTISRSTMLAGMADMLN